MQVSTHSLPEEQEQFVTPRPIQKKRTSQLSEQDSEDKDTDSPKPSEQESSNVQCSLQGLANSSSRMSQQYLFDAAMCQAVILLFPLPLRKRMR